MSEIIESKPSFLKNHIDTIAIIGVNLAIAAILTSLWISNSHRIDAANARTDSICLMIHQEMKDFHGRLCAIEERNRK
jgi:hypothetical protein